MKKNPLHVAAGMVLALALLGAFAITISPAPTIIRVIAASVGITTVVVLGIVYYVIRKGNRRGK